MEIEESGNNYGYIGRKENLRIAGISDASFKTSKKAVGVIILFLVRKDIMRASLIH